MRISNVGVWAVCCLAVLAGAGCAPGDERDEVTEGEAPTPPSSTQAPLQSQANIVKVMIQNFATTTDRGKTYKLCLSGQDPIPGVGYLYYPKMNVCNAQDPYFQWIIRSDNQTICNVGNGLCLDDRTPNGTGLMTKMQPYNPDLYLNGYYPQRFSWTWGNYGRIILSSHNYAVASNIVRYTNVSLKSGNTWDQAQNWILWEL